MRVGVSLAGLSGVAGIVTLGLSLPEKHVDNLKRGSHMTKLPQNFNIGIGRFSDTNFYIKMTIGDIRSHEHAKALADAIAKWLTSESGWIEHAQPLRPNQDNSDQWSDDEKEPPGAWRQW